MRKLGAHTAVAVTVAVAIAVTVAGRLALARYTIPRSTTAADASLFVRLGVRPPAPRPEPQHL